ncbi:MAG: 2-oxo acid dehydrogenase subunit E2, partial [Clostridia bacterium]|nr:2-oxo acid dehydrogenase subunit E2 [Clostridia bacterium]
MFGKRSDGRRLKKINPLFLLMPHIMKRMSDAQVFYSQEIPIAPLDEYIAKKDAEGIKMSYMAIIYASLVRILAEKPLINRFVINGRIYARNSIDISLVIKKGMSDTADETPIKLHFSGSENIFDIRNRLEQAIIKNKEVTAENATDKLAKTLSFIPSWLIKFIVNLLMFLDRHDLMPKFVIEASPFHTSAFLTNVGSLGIDSIYHHLYDFGTTGVFLAMGKKKKSLINVDEALAEEKILSLRWVLDERICDGYYYANAVKLFNKYMKKPEL